MSNLKDRVKEAARGRWPELFATLCGLSPEILDGKHHPCPQCGGKDRFRVIDIEEGALFCNQCFREKNGDGIAAVSWLTGWDFKETLRQLADQLGIPKSNRKTPEDTLEWREWNEGLVRLWLLRKPGITMEALEANGARLADWRGVNTVIALPIQITTKRKPVGWVFWSISGEPLRKRSGQESKILCTTGSKAGWIGAAGLEALEAGTAVVVWKVEGPSDMLALYSALPPGARSKHIVLSNAFGAGERPGPKLLEILRGRTVCVCHDPDEAGQKGAERWAGAITQVARITVPVTLPDPKKDLRDWLATGHTYDELLAIARETVPTEKQAQTQSQTASQAADSGATDGQQDQGDEPTNQADNDPARLAREFIRLEARRVAYWREDFYYWQDGRWVEMPRSNFRSDVGAFLEQEFQRIQEEGVQAKKQSEEEPAKAIKVTENIIRSVTTMIGVLTCVSSSIEWGAELDRPATLERIKSGRPQRWVAVENGILDIPAFLDGKSDVLRDHSPDWWSPLKLPFKFNGQSTLKDCPCWRSFLNRNLEGDQGRINLLQEWTGYCLLPDTDQQRFMILEGEGANGKSVYCSVLEALLGGENVSHVQLEVWGQRFQLTPSLGKLANIITEIGELDKVAEGLLKAYVDGSGMTFDRKGRDHIEARPTAKLVIATNNRPRFCDRSAGLWRRMLIIPWNVQIPEDERITGMDQPKFWLRSGEMPGILNWAIQGLDRLYKQESFSVPAIVEETKEDYRQDTNPARAFLFESYKALDINSHIYVSCSDLYKEYCTYCEQNGYRQLGSRTFGKEVKRTFPGSKKARKGSDFSRFWAYKGIAEKTEADREEEAKKQELRLHRTS